MGLAFESGAIERVFRGHPEVTFALVFGSSARGTSHQGSDLDVAVGLRSGTRWSARELGAVIAALESSVRRTVDVTLLDEATAALAFRVFRDGREVYVADRGALVNRRARAILDYLDFKPVEQRCAEGVLRVARGR